MAESNKDFRLMAAVSHASILLTAFTLVGILVPLIIWLTQKEKSKYAAFQAMQALVFQAAFIAASLLVGILFFIFGLVVAFLTFGLGSLLFIPLILFILVAGFAVIVYGLYAAYKCFEGEDFKYYWLGEWLAKTGWSE